MKEKEQLKIESLVNIKYKKKFLYFSFLIIFSWFLSCRSTSQQKTVETEKTVEIANSEEIITITEFAELNEKISNQHKRFLAACQSAKDSAILRFQNEYLSNFQKESSYNGQVFKNNLNNLNIEKTETERQLVGKSCKITMQFKKK